MGISIFKTSNSKTEQIDISTAYNIWNLLKARYSSFEDTQMLQNFVHDRDLNILMDALVNNFQDQIKQLEKLAETFNIKVPSRPPAGVKTSVKINEITDKYIFIQIYNDVLSELFSLTRRVRTTLTSDRIRKIFIDFLLTYTKQFTTLDKYGRLKGWEQVDPSYKTPKPQMDEPLSISEAFHIWDHLRVRYYNLHITQFFEGFAHDLDFKAGMAVAVRTLDKQIKKLEQLALKFEVPLPDQPPALMKVAIDPEVLEDKFMYQQLFVGIDNMVGMHIRAFVEMTRNDDLGDFFTKLFREEIDIHDSMLKYGKTKGWLQTPPVHSQGINA